MNAPQTTQPLITVSIAQLLGKEIAGLTAQVTDPKWFEDGIEPKWRKLKAVKRKKEYQKWWITLHYHTEGDDTCGFTGGIEGPKTDNMKIQFTAEEFAKIQPAIQLPAPSIHRSYFIEKPETLEAFSLTAEVWKDENGKELSFSFLWRRGCSLSPTFDELHHERFETREALENRCDALYNEYRQKGFKTREELGLQRIGDSHDATFLNFQKQLIERYLEALVTRLDIPPND